MTVTVHAADIQLAQARISASISPTPLQYCPRLSQLTGTEVYLKREDLQDVRSYKIRGAMNAIAQLSEEQRGAGIVAASAGNHAQGVAFACRTMGIKGRIYVPAATPKQKRDRIMVHGGELVELVVTGANFDEAADAARAYAAETGATMVEPFDNRNTVIGQGTVAAEVLSQLTAIGKSIDAIVVPVGGGGLISGIVSYFADMTPRTPVIGVEPAGAPSLEAALEANEPVTLQSVDPFVDGAAVKRIGDLNFEIIEANKGRIHAMTVSEGAVATEMIDLYQNEGIIAEPAGALSVAGLRELNLPAGAVVVCIISGGNNDVLRYAEIMERSLVHRGLKHYFLVNFPQEPGQLRTFLNEILGPDDDITLFEYLKRNNRETGTALVGLQLGRATDLDGLLERMDASRIDCRRLEPGTAEYNFLVS
ncbi:threonine ammonia-lyase IlvA [Corynebacterium sp. 153RC1]|uniref:threonine ammonia-lyase IlvA n=1 Tax=unclassified Corynebacterium TaxID=2624378 RepID=UPI00211B911C|nr:MULTISPECIES: threonine ammonia-lyase IlvA [unclassified Corynebacterium]MCQ9351703.1 threonine ammonia-lyase IlvA [Corynebacterium sp. 209RC1]MCQ9354072.1 threonine ammonia-lyase IlvA [Corynebacterium sp. 1222RC1]MCQ9355986.1 threonine ammonia-lyase IlvA [Corynebacterium sp. 122RC1]MCQ9358230.1 threonine ammonia-lyase IlvA [Corynebacterium sp. 142RC1]MCQ9360166.1 threonine ammonia-lyase IlvA [Corynebacterium sp. 153RC1]